MDARLAHLSSLAQKDKGPAYLSLITDVLAKGDPATVVADVHKVVESVLQDNVVIGRQVLQELAKGLAEPTIQDTGLKKQVVKDILQVVQPRLVSYEEQVRITVSVHQSVACSSEYTSPDQCPQAHLC